MQFSFEVGRILKDPVTAWDRASLMSVQKEFAPKIKEIVDRMGLASSKAQGLKTAVTSYNVLLQSPDQRLYIFTEGKLVLGIIKIGRKKLFIRNELDIHREITPLCVLDFYVHESMQRTGKGKMLFEAMMERENLQPWKLAYDRPSPKFVNFLRKHYGLVDFTPQANNFVVFKRYFEDSRSPSRNDQPNASVSMRPLTATQKPVQRRNSFDASQMRPQQPSATGYYTPQKPASRPDSVTPLALHQLPKNGYNPYSVKSNPPPAKTQPPRLPLPSSIPPQNTNGYHDDYNNEEEGDYNNNNERDYNDNHGTGNGYNDDGYTDQGQGDGYDGSISPEDYANNQPRRPNNNDTYESTYGSPSTSRHTPFATTASEYGSHSPAHKRPPSPSRRPSPSLARPPPTGPMGQDNATFHRANAFNPGMNLNGNGIFGLSSGAQPETPTRGRSPARRSESPFDTSSPSLSRTSPAPSSTHQRSESPFATTNDLERSSPAPSTHQRSKSPFATSDLERTHVPPKGLGTMGSFNQSFNYPMKFEKDLAAPPQQTTSYKDSSLFPPRRETQPPRSPAYRLNAASRLNSREMDHLESSMRNALTTIDNHEKRVSIIDDGGYRAISPEPKAPSRQDVYQSPQARSIFSSVQSHGSPVARSVSPSRQGNTERLDTNFNKTDYHKKFHDDNPNLMSSAPSHVRVHPNSRSRQSPFPS